MGHLKIGNTIIDESDAGQDPERFSLYTARAPGPDGECVARVPRLDDESDEGHRRRELDEGRRRRDAYMSLVKRLRIVRCGPVRGVWSGECRNTCDIDGTGYWTDSVGTGRTGWEGETALRERLRREGFSWGQIGTIETLNDWRYGPFRRNETVMMDTLNGEFSPEQVDNLTSTEAWRRGKLFLSAEDATPHPRVIDHQWWARLENGENILIVQPDMFLKDAVADAEEVARTWGWGFEVIEETSWYNDNPILAFRARPHFRTQGHFRRPPPSPAFIDTIQSHTENEKMAAPGDTYERELKYLLAGEEKSIRKMVKTCDDWETKAYESMAEHPFMVIRAAGSLGVDLVALRWDFSFPIEVKSSEKDVLYMSKSERLIDQARRMREDCARSHLIPLYAFRLKGIRGDPWRVFTLPSDTKLVGRAALLKRRIPAIEVSSNGNPIMRWNDGMKLSDLLAYVGMSDREE